MIALFTTDKPIIVAFHGCPWLIHRLTYRRSGHPNLHVRGYKGGAATTTWTAHRGRAQGRLDGVFAGGAERVAPFTCGCDVTHWRAESHPNGPDRLANLGTIVACDRDRENA
jgi:hypothetical protein